MVLKLNLEECNLLISLLTTAVAETKEEIYRTEKYEYKTELKTEKALMESILSRLIEISMGGERPN